MCQRKATIVFAVGMLAAAGAAQAQGAEMAARCAALYKKAIFADRAWTIIEGFTDVINPQDRGAQLMDRFGLDRYEMIDAGLNLADPRFTSGQVALEAAAVEELADCDRAFGFEPVARLTASAAERVTPELLSRAEALHARRVARAEDCAVIWEQAAAETGVLAGDGAEVLEARRTVMITGYFVDRRAVTRRAIEGMFGGEWSSPPIHEALAAPDPARQRAAIGEIAACDRLFAFVPVTRHIDDTAPDPAAPDDFACAVAYWVFGALRQEERQLAWERAGHAVRQHAEEHQGEDSFELEQQVLAQGRDTVARLNAGEADGSSVMTSVQVCETRYGSTAGGE